MAKTAITLKKGDTVHMYAFTGMYLGEFEISESGKKKVKVQLKNGFMGEFDRETGKQTNAPSGDKYANTLSEQKKNKDDALPYSGKKKTEKGKAKKSDKAVAKSKKSKEEDDEEEDEEEKAPQKSKKSSKKKSSKKAKPTADEEDEDEDEDLDDED